MDPEDEMILNKVPSDLMLNEREVIRQTGKMSIKDFLQQHSIYEVVRDSGKIIVFDINIPIQLAFYALLEHDTPAAPLWDSGAREFVGLMSVTDFIDILRHYHRKGIPMDELSARSISEVMSDAQGRRLQHSLFLGTPVDASVYQACVALRRHNHRFLPVVPPQPSEAGVLCIVSCYDVLQFLVNQFREQRRLFEDSVADLEIGTFGDKVVTVPRHTRLIEVLDLMEKRDIMAVPVVDEDERVLSLYSRSDVTFLAAARDTESVISNLDMTVGQLIELRAHTEGAGDGAAASADPSPPTCSMHTSLQSLFELFFSSGFHMVVCVDEDHRCVGVVSVRDLITYFVQDDLA